MKTNEELLKENAELRAAVKCLKGQFQQYMQTADIKIYMDVMNSTPAQHLADIQADAQRECLTAIRADLGNHISKATEIGEIDFLLFLRFTDRMVQEYASKIRGESK